MRDAGRRGRVYDSRRMKTETENEKELHFSSYDDFRKWTETKAGYWILLRGVPLPSPSPSRIHQRVSKRLQSILMQAIENQNLGEVYDAPLDVKLTADTVYQPDLLVISKEHSGRMKPTHIEGAPDLIVEILSHSTAKLDLVDKRYDYAASGVREYWIVDPETETIEIYTLESGTLILKNHQRKTGNIQSILFPQVNVDLEKLFH
jgi:Uma2 family endonuclease